MQEHLRGISSLLEIEKEDLPFLRENALDPEQDKLGQASGVIPGCLESIGICEYLLNNDINAFKDKFAESIRIELRLFERADTGDGVSKSYTSMTTGYQILLKALAVGDFELVNIVASTIGGRHEIEKENDHKFDIALGYALKYFVIKDEENMQKWLKSFTDICASKVGNNYDRAFANFLNAVSEKDVAAANKAVENIAKERVKRAKRDKSIIDELFCLWGIAVVNLARFYYGMDVSSSNPIIPSDLLVKIR